MKKVLIITYHWPPSGGITVLRCLKIAKYLRSFGWEPVIFTAKNAAYQFEDTTNERDIPENCEMHQVPILEPINFFKLLSGRKKNKPLQNITANTDREKKLIDIFGMWVRGNFFIPDARYRWIKPSVRYLSKYLKKNKVDAIFTDGPPHTNTVIGLHLAQRFNIPWLADFQDPWTQVDYYQELYIGKRADKKHKALELVFKQANAITIASPTWKNDLEEIGAKNVDVLYYGFDESDFLDYQPSTPEKIIFFHGGLLGKDRMPSGLFKAIASARNKYPEVLDKIEIRLAGEVDHTIKQEIKSRGLDGITSYLGMIPRTEVVKEIAKARILLLPINQAKNANGRIPGKLFELLRSEKPILAFGSLHSDVQRVLHETKRGKLVAYEDVPGIEQIIEDLLDGYSLGWFDPTSDISNYSNQQLTKKVAKILDSICDKK